MPATIQDVEAAIRQRLGTISGLMVRAGEPTESEMDTLSWPMAYTLLWSGERVKQSQVGYNDVTFLVRAAVPFPEDGNGSEAELTLLPLIDSIPAALMTSSGSLQPQSLNGTCLLVRLDWDSGERGFYEVGGERVRAVDFLVTTRRKP